MRGAESALRRRVLVAGEEKTAISTTNAAEE
jgi:hypothetical protein